MVVYGVLGYIFLDSGLNTKTRVRVDCEDSSNVYYDVKYLDDNYNNTDSGKYVANMVNYIDMNYIYDNIISEYVSGYYKYNVLAYLYAYGDNISDTIWFRKYDLVDEKIVSINNNDNIELRDSFKLNFKKYQNELSDFIDSQEDEINGYLNIKINVIEYLNINDEPFK